MRQPGNRGFLPLILASSLALTGCLGAEAPQAENSQLFDSTRIEPAAVPDPQAIAKVNQLLTPDPAAEAGRIRAARKCMAEKGITDWTMTLRSTMRFEVDPGRPSSIEAARMYGYEENRHTSTFRQGQGEDHPAYRGSEPRAMADLLGDSNQEGWVSIDGLRSFVAKDGCYAQSLIDVYGSIQDGDTVTQTTHIYSLFAKALVSAEESPEGQKLLGEWRDCVKAATGREFTNMRTPSDELGGASAEEKKRVAVEDLRCAEKTKYQQRWNRILGAYLTVALKMHEGKIFPLMEIRKKGAAAAGRIS